MPLKTVVKVGNISNLSDARYCSGMGVDMLGFCVIEGQPNYISPKLFQEIRGWIPGPKVVAEIYGIPSVETLAVLIKDYAPDYFELSQKEFATYSPHISIPCIVSITSADVASLKKEEKSIAYLLLEETSLSATTGVGKPSLLKINSHHNLLEKLQQHAVAGVALNGSHEIRPGFKEYNELADILELLDE
jgi:phosphoribosylanthranilate isomerase